MHEMTQEDAARALLAWYAEMGVDEAVADSPSDFFGWAPPAVSMQASPAPRPAPPKRAPAPVVSIAPAPLVAADEAIKAAEAAARA
ncbi:MAG: hypothetical protein RIC52_07475, partial [Amphiplicatus sp.]